MITFAVILGFLVTDWGEDHRERERADEALERIEAELRVNAEVLERSLPYWERMGEVLDSIVEVEGDVTVWSLETPEGWRGLSPPTIRRASWEVAQATGALEQVPFGRVDELAIAYAWLEDLDGVVDQAIASLMQGRLELLTEWLRTFTLLGEIGRTAAHAIAGGAESQTP